MVQMERRWSLAERVPTEAAVQALTFEKLFTDQHERLYRALYLIVGNSHEAEELMQDAFLDAGRVPAGSGTVGPHPGDPSRASRARAAGLVRPRPARHTTQRVSTDVRAD